MAVRLVGEMDGGMEVGGCADGRQPDPLRQVGLAGASEAVLFVRCRNKEGRHGKSRQEFIVRLHHLLRMVHMHQQVPKVIQKQRNDDARNNWRECDDARAPSTQTHDGGIT